MTHDGPERMSIHTIPIATDLKSRFEELLPGVINDGVLDVVRLGEILGVPTGGTPQDKEGFGLTWAGRKDAVAALRTSSFAALAPDHENSINFDTAKNVFIEGDNFEVLQLIQKAYNDQVDLLYIDPPYNTGDDFVYKDDFSDGVRRYLEVSGQVDAEGNRLFSNTESTGRLHSNWLRMMFSRLVVARNLLAEGGLLCVSIDDNEVANLSLILDEIFGEENRLARLIWNRGHSQQQGIFKEYHEYVLVYARNAGKLRHFNDPEGGEVIGGALKKISKANPASEFLFPAGVRCDAPDGTEFIGTWGEAEKITLVSGRFRVLGGRTQDAMTLSAGWTQKNQMTASFAGEAEVVDTKGQRVVEFYFNSTGKLKYKKERTAYTPPTVHAWGTQGAASKALVDFMGADLFDRPKPISMIKELIAWVVPADGLVLDFFAGSGTTGHATMQQNALDGGRRRYVLINASEKTDTKSNAFLSGFQMIPEITRLRLKKVTENVAGAREQGLRCLHLGPSSFVDVSGLDSGGLPFLVENTLRPAVSDDEIVAEVLLKHGVRLDEEWIRSTYGPGEVVKSGGVAVVLARKASKEVIDAALDDTSVQTVIFLEDSFAGLDDVKSNAYFGFKNHHKTMKTI